MNTDCRPHAIVLSSKFNCRLAILLAATNCNHTSDASSLGFTMAMNVAAQAGAAAGGEQVKAKLVVASMIVPVNGRLIYLYANSVFNSPADRQWAESAVQAWRDSLLAVNPRVQGFDFADLGKFGKSGLIGAGLGALLGIILIILRKSRS